MLISSLLFISFIILLLLLGVFIKIKLINLTPNNKETQNIIKILNKIIELLKKQSK